MELYFGSFSDLGDGATDKNLVSFAIPDIGVKFKAPFEAENITLDYASLLTLLEFIEINPQLFGNKALELFSHNIALVTQVKTCRVPSKDLAPYLQKALKYRSKLKYSINWISFPDNPAQNPEID
ncbi:MAG: hypothetical protein GY841_02045 [FCB group bacterium]|nr:hypothetical protein [FCB group bacterium]